MSTPVVVDKGDDVVLPGGFTGEIVALRRDHVVVRVPGLPGLVTDDSVAAAQVLLRPGDLIEVDGVLRPLTPKAPVRAPKPAAARPGVTATSHPCDRADPALVERLKNWRRERARRDGKAPFMILHDMHLCAIVEQAPSTLRELAGCPGIGPTKLELYGDDILEVLAG